MHPDRSRPEGARRTYFKCPWTSSRTLRFFTRHFVGPKNRRDRAFFSFSNVSVTTIRSFSEFFFPTIDNSWSSNSKAQARVHDEKDKTNFQFPIPSLSPCCRINLDRLIQVAVRGLHPIVGPWDAELTLIHDFHFLIPMVSVRIFPFSATHTRSPPKRTAHISSIPAPQNTMGSLFVLIIECYPYRFSIVIFAFDLYGITRFYVVIESGSRADIDLKSLKEN